MKRRGKRTKEEMKEDYKEEGTGRIMRIKITCRWSKGEWVHKCWIAFGTPLVEVEWKISYGVEIFRLKWEK